jgi:hypothetical protein
VVAADAADPVADLVDAGDTLILSDERRTTRWVHAQRGRRSSASRATGRARSRGGAF